MTINLLTLIALWCGAPIPGYTYTTDATYIGPYTSIQDVNQCRKNLISCLDRVDPIDDSSKSKCFEKQPHPGGDQ